MLVCYDNLNYCLYLTTLIESPYLHSLEVKYKKNELIKTQENTNYVSNTIFTPMYNVPQPLKSRHQTQYSFLKLFSLHTTWLLFRIQPTYTLCSQILKGIQTQKWMNECFISLKQVNTFINEKNVYNYMFTYFEFALRDPLANAVNTKHKNTSIPLILWCECAIRDSNHCPLGPKASVLIIELRISPQPFRVRKRLNIWKKAMQLLTF